MAEGYTEARKQIVRREETSRREFIEDLFRGDADVGRLVERAELFGLDMGRPTRWLWPPRPAGSAMPTP
jgi:hypothetical protein